MSRAPKADFESSGSPSPERGGGRLHLLDALRGIAVISMVLFHLCYDLAYIKGIELPFFHPPLIDVWRASISWTFLAIAGISCGLARDNLRRAGRYLALAAALFSVTSIARVDTPISFGIIFCMGASTLLYALLERVGAAPRGPLAALLLACGFLLCLGVPAGKFGLLGLQAPLPHALYETPWLSWLGMPGPGFASGDYYPLLPYSLLFLAGAALSGPAVELLARIDERAPRIAPLEAIGRHPLEVYVAHQPAILGLLALLGF